ncbi:efflux RND transporter periplasmic adaptor subunit [Gaoshiqia sp. Z1-71]|uniref:efflux RND transporter periplasmic adaptor subunit n=1 Tax=Gaoshiqia hydrogeniformans TaxID=3290090 RepID=UPI003BF88381
MKTNEKMRKRRTNLSAGTIVLVTVLSGFYLTGCESSRGDTPPAPAMKVPVAAPLYQPVTEWEEYSGRFRAIKRVEVRARVGGYVDQVLFRDGELVRKGAVLFRIDPRPFQIVLNQAEARLEQAKAEKQQAENAFDRVKSLKESKAISREEYDQREQALNIAIAREEAAKADVAQAKLNLEFTEVRAPISGKISEEFVTEGNLISGGSDQASLLTTIVSLDPIYFYFEGSESSLLKYARKNNGDNLKGAAGPNARIAVKLLDEDEFQHEGSFNFMDNEVDRGTGTYQGRAVVSNPDLVITSGMFGSARVFNNDPQPAILIPDEVIGTDQSQKFVYVLSGDNRVEARPIVLGPLHNSKLRIIRNGVDPNDRIIIGNIQKIRPTMVVEPEARVLSIN